MTDALVEKIGAAAIVAEAKAGTVGNADSYEEWSKRRRIAIGRAILAAIDSSGTHVVVPVEPTDRMQDAGDDGHYGMAPAAIWEAMLYARPKVKE